ncbi:MAG: M28 family peptidase [Microbacterium sp.]
MSTDTHRILPPLGDVDPAALKRHVDVIASVDRESGTEGDWASARYIASFLEDQGIPVRLETTRTITSRPLSAGLRLGSGVELDCITQSYSGQADGLTAPLMRVDDALTRDGDYSGHVVVTFGLASPLACRTITDLGAAGIVFINDSDYPHNMAISSVWGMPSREEIPQLAYPPVVSVTRGTGREILAYIDEAEEATATLRTSVDTGLRDLPLVVADIVGGASETDRFVMLNGHVDSWHRGGVDNGTGNAAMLEIARIAHRHRNQLSTNLRIVFWSGHSDGRYSGSDWYADHAWMDLHDNCVVNFNIDSIGAKGATAYPRVYASAHCYRAGLAAVHELTGESPEYTRIERNGDQSFWNHGVPSLFQVLSLFPADSAGGSTFVAGLPWHWHTTQDLPEEAGPEEMALDSQIYLSAIWDFCASRAYPFVFADLAEEVHASLSGAHERTGEGIAALGALVSASASFIEDAKRFDRLIERVRRAELDAATAELVNTTSMRINRAVIPVLNCATSPFHTDGALPQALFPGLKDLDLFVRHEDELVRAAHEREIVREGNRIGWMLETVRRSIAACLTEVGG